jgi:transketolase
MRNEFRDTVAEVMVQSDTTFFLTGDLGYNALEKVRDCAGARFINAGVAEQSMVGVAAGIASLGNEAFVYSIAPFVTFRCLEQVRLDVCIHDLPVYIVGNGGGYGYGIMGATHHAIEDIGSMSSLDNMVCWIPAFADDVAPCVHAIRSERKPAYLRLGMGRNRPEASEKFASVSCVNRGATPQVTVLTMGPVIGNVLDALHELECEADLDVFSIARIPFDDTAAVKIIASLQKTQKLLIVEEHVTRGGLAEYVLTVLADAEYSKFTTHRLYAKGYPNKLYGSQQYHQSMSGIDVKSISSLLRAML